MQDDLNSKNKRKYPNYSKNKIGLGRNYHML
ncbi:hypothetical protein FlaCF_0030 [Flavobacterium tructae]